MSEVQCMYCDKPVDATEAEIIGCSYFHPACVDKASRSSEPWPTELDLLSTTDAKVWAQEFMRLFGDRRDVIDEDLMLTWFANAMAAEEMKANVPYLNEFLQRMEGKI